MRPLPVLDDLPPSQPVFDQTADDFNLLLGGDLSSFDSYQTLLDSTTDGVVGASDDLSSTLDTIGSIFDGIDGTFGALDSSLSQLAYEQEISDTLAIDNAFASNVNSWAPDLEAGIAAFADFLVTIYDDVIAPIINALWQALTDLLNTIVNQLIGLILSLVSALNPGLA